MAVLPFRGACSDSSLLQVQFPASPVRTPICLTQTLLLADVLSDHIFGPLPFFFQNHLNGCQACSSQLDEFISQQVPHISTAPGTSRLCEKTKERQDCCHGINSDTLRLGMITVQSFVGTSSNRTISRESGRHNQWRTELRGLTY